jgi:hypothetical protein
MLSSTLYHYYNRQSHQIINPKTSVDNAVNVIKSVRSYEHFFSIYFVKKETITPVLTVRPQTGPSYFQLKFKFNSDIVVFLFLRITFKCVICIIFGEPAAVFGSDNRIKVAEICRPEFDAAGSLCFLVSEVSGNKAQQD